MMLLASGIFTVIMSSTSSMRGIPASLIMMQWKEGGGDWSHDHRQYNNITRTNAVDDHYPALHKITLTLDSLCCLKGDGEVLLGVICRQVIVGNLIGQEGMENGTESQTIRPALTEVLHLHILLWLVGERIIVVHS